MVDFVSNSFQTLIASDRNFTGVVKVFGQPAGHKILQVNQIHFVSPSYEVV